ncbi:hypothetical protein V8E55_009852 [Tylopilus felleus]
MLSGDLPVVLIEQHAHWLDLSTSIMEVWPLDRLWETSSENWKMYCTSGWYHMQKGNQHLIDIRSQSWTMNLLVTVPPIDSSRPMSPLQLSVSLPRYGLSFYVDKDGDLQSDDMRGMVYDENQSIETLFGLVNRLVLRPKSRDLNAVKLIPRCILIPDGEISFQKDGHHVRVKVNTPPERVTYQTYNVDIDLGCLMGNVSLTNKLYCMYLHALTSGCSTNPLTGRTGIEEALSLLRSASCSSIMWFSACEAELFGLIASICPAHTWYPAHLKCMQRWSGTISPRAPSITSCISLPKRSTATMREFSYFSRTNPAICSQAFRRTTITFFSAVHYEVDIYSHSNFPDGRPGQTMMSDTLPET